VATLGPGSSTGQPWTVGSVTVAGGTWITTFPTTISQTVGTLMTGLLSAVGSNSLDANGVGTVTLVTPMTFRSSFAPFLPVGAIGELKLVFVPEPGLGSAFMLGAALVLVLAGSKTRSRAYGRRRARWP
jgi:hypothetical protein